MNDYSEESRLDLNIIFDHLLVYARDNPSLALAMHRQARRVIEALDGVPCFAPVVEDSLAVDTPQEPAESLSTSLLNEPAPAPASPESLELLLAAFQGGNRNGGSGGDGEVNVADESLPTVSRSDRHRQLAGHCRLKARAADWRVRLLLGEDDAEERQTLVEEARRENLFLWPLSDSSGTRADSGIDFQRFADTCTVCAEALDAWDRLPTARAEEILPLIAEAQSMMRVAASLTGLTHNEETAENVFWWLRQTTAYAGVYIERFMRPGNPADPDAAHELGQRVARLLDPPPMVPVAPPRKTAEAAQEPRTGDEEVDEEPPTPEVARVRELLQGRTVALFCGNARPDKRDALQEAFALNDLLWDDIPNKYTQGDHGWIFNRPDLDLVLIAVRWLSHCHTDNLPKRATERGVPVVFLPAGYGVNRVAHAILEQASEKLTALA